MIEKIIEPVIKVNNTAIIGTRIFIKFEDWDLAIIDGSNLFIFSTHK